MPVTTRGGAVGELPAEWFYGWPVELWVDNSGALGGLIKGYSGRPDSLSIIRAFHAANLAMQANVWFNYVASKANVADLPSRGDLDLMAEVLLQASPSFSLSDDVVDLVLSPRARATCRVYAAYPPTAAASSVYLAAAALRRPPPPCRRPRPRRVVHLWCI